MGEAGRVHGHDGRLIGEGEVGMPRVRMDFASFSTDILLPRGTDVIRAREPVLLPDVSRAVDEALTAPIGCPPLSELCARALERMRGSVSAPTSEGVAPPALMTPREGAAKPDTPLPQTVVVVISDDSRPVPYKGESGILWPLVRLLLDAGFPAHWITLLVATGTHHPLTHAEIWDLVDPRVREAGVRVSCHDAADAASLVSIDGSNGSLDGARGGGSGGDLRVSVNRVYAEAGLRILTGLVEPHFMAGASGGRKSICPGLLDVASVRDFHGPAVVAAPGIGDLRLEGNPCHEYSLAVAALVPPDFILNVAARPDGQVVGVFCGEMRAAHAAAVEQLRSYSEVWLEREYDIVVTHAARVGINHYQASKTMGSAAPAVREGGYLILVADTTDADPVGSVSYRRLLGLLAERGPLAFQDLLTAEDWQFAQDQWAVQSLALLQERVPLEHTFYFSPQTPRSDFALLPCRHPGTVLPDLRDGERTRPVNLGDAAAPCRQGAGEMVSRFVGAAVEEAAGAYRTRWGREPRIACLADGPHCVPRVSDGGARS